MQHHAGDVVRFARIVREEVPQRIGDEHGAPIVHLLFFHAVHVRRPRAEDHVGAGARKRVRLLERRLGGLRVAALAPVGQHDHDLRARVAQGGNILRGRLPRGADARRIGNDAHLDSADFHHAARVRLLLGRIRACGGKVALLQNRARSAHAGYAVIKNPVRAEVDEVHARALERDGQRVGRAIIAEAAGRTVVKRSAQRGDGKVRAAERAGNGLENLGKIVHTVALPAACAQLRAHHYLSGGVERND